jgi:predicted acyltransferase
VRNERPQRIVSLDVFRGLTIAAMILVNNPGSWGSVYGPLRHAGWNGWTLADLVFPFFLFAVGVSVALSFGRRAEAGEDRGRLYLKIVRRTLILFALGLLLNGFPGYDLPSVRIPGVLQRISICYLAAAVIFIESKWKGRLAWASGLLLLYWAAMQWVPFPGGEAGLYEKGNNLASWIDGRLLAGHMWQATKTWDPEGIFSTIPAISTTLLGTLAGDWLRSGAGPSRRAAGLFPAGGAAAALGALWGLVMPINKSLWTSSYAVFTAGLASICLGALFWLIDVRGWERWTWPARVLGTNAITAYVLAGIAARLLYLIKVTGEDGTQTALKIWIYQNLFASWLGSGMSASLAFAITFILAVWLCMLPLHSRKIFIRI